MCDQRSCKIEQTNKYGTCRFLDGIHLFVQIIMIKHFTGGFGQTNQSGVSMYLDDPRHNSHSELCSNSLVHKVQTNKSGVSMYLDDPCHILHSELCSNSMVHLVQTHNRFKMITMNSELVDIT